MLLRAGLERVGKKPGPWHTLGFRPSRAGSQVEAVPVAQPGKSTRKFRMSHFFLSKTVVFLAATHLWTVFAEILNGEKTLNSSNSVNKV